ncbi:hypothetical protein C7S18_19070 [Ahniella affigens]|uniref:Uncharacterized protein n=1 Tax=Ahniella affigens TaxID=2021234 RepID=A0A2P1PWC4_9GAMM|nr:hypothetical protein C7S18_19070 [Ahniella affigens]
MIQNDLQSWIVVALVLMSAFYAWYRLAPQTAMTVERHLVLWLLRPGRAAGLARLGRRLAPRHRAGANATTCGAACSGCKPDDRAESL